MLSIFNAIGTSWGLEAMWHKKKLGAMKQICIETYELPLIRKFTLSKTKKKKMKCILS